jgi:hypothetical protein
MDYKEYSKYLVCAVAALTVLVIGLIKPGIIMDKDGCLNSMWMALIVFVVCVLTQMFV